tara:strand:+ start:374 stop:520 length:147 start_codon:yes stop_codon:yes gene_type:complete
MLFGIVMVVVFVAATSNNKKIVAVQLMKPVIVNFVLIDSPPIDNVWYK